MAAPKKLKNIFGNSEQQQNNVVNNPQEQQINNFQEENPELNQNVFTPVQNADNTDFLQQTVNENGETNYQYADNNTNIQQINNQQQANFVNDNQQQLIQFNNNEANEFAMDTNNFIQNKNDELSQHTNFINQNDMRLAPPTKNTGVFVNEAANVPQSNAILQPVVKQTATKNSIWGKHDDDQEETNEMYHQMDKDTLELVNHNRLNMIGEATAYTNAPIIIDPFANEHDNLHINKLQRKDMIWVFSLSTLSIILLGVTIILLIVMIFN